jgi:hypothetical protein
MNAAKFLRVVACVRLRADLESLPSVLGALTLRPPTNRPRDIPTHTIHFVHCDNFLLRHFDHVTFFYCEILTLWQFYTVTLRPCDIFLLCHSDSVTIFYCDTSTMLHFSTVTFRLCDNYLLWHSVSKWTDCPFTPKGGRFVTLWHSDPLYFWPTHGCDILSTLDFDFYRRCLVQVAANFDRWWSHDSVPLTFWVFFWLFVQSVCSFGSCSDF